MTPYSGASEPWVAPKTQTRAVEERSNCSLRLLPSELSKRDLGHYIPDRGDILGVWKGRHHTKGPRRLFPPL